MSTSCLIVHSCLAILLSIRKTNYTPLYSDGYWYTIYAYVMGTRYAEIQWYSKRVHMLSVLTFFPNCNIASKMFTYGTKYGPLCIIVFHNTLCAGERGVEYVWIFWRSLVVHYIVRTHTHMLGLVFVCITECW